MLCWKRDRPQIFEAEVGDFAASAYRLAHMSKWRWRVLCCGEIVDGGGYLPALEEAQAAAEASIRRICTDALRALGPEEPPT